MDNVSLSELIAYPAAQVNPLDSFNPDRLVFKAAWGFFDILAGCFAVCLSTWSLLIKSLLIHITSLAIVEIHFSSFFRFVSWESLDQILRQSVKFTYTLRLLICSKRAHLCKNERGSFCFQSFPNNLWLWLITCQVMSILWKAWNANTKTEASCIISGGSAVKIA